MNIFHRAINEGHAYRVSKRHTLADGEELTVLFDPVAAGGAIAIETPAINTPQACDVDVWESAQPDGTANDTADDLFVHNMRYDLGDGRESPEATIQRVTNGSLDTSSADKTEETRLQANREYNTPGGEALRTIWRVIPIEDTVAITITDQSNGSGNVYGFDTVVYESGPYPDD